MRSGRAGRTGAGRGGGAGPAASNPVLCVHNLSRFAQPAELDLARWADRTPVELLGRVPFPSVGTATYGVTLGPYGFYWFELMDHDPMGGEDRSDGAPR
jgi:maltose alpha-D-glucosyltransferase/alpha-amylase